LVAEFGGVVLGELEVVLADGEPDWLTCTDPSVTATYPTPPVPPRSSLLAVA
jgi:hypothetical protein